MKVPVVVAAMTAGRADPADVQRAITRSDNDAARRLWDALDDGPGEVEAVLPRGWSSFGRTVWSLDAAAGFYRALATGELLGPPDTERILDAMGCVVPEQRWGLGTVPGMRFKGGRSFRSAAPTAR